ncbi:zinc finger protein 182-like [Corythoichthys intestinalis]|uniref:zinc finger protein 182-like n=1 Tax=Corythoichthys intestinalis TaxID=161448 RepID=UPI0025A63A1B|nr:zinc finger protein 182-like [Corythoichthys intestinalis]
MLKVLVKERLIAAAEEIFGLFERTIASYEEQLCRVREENERIRRQSEAVCNTQIVLRVEGPQQMVVRREEPTLPLPQLTSSSLQQENQNVEEGPIQAHNIKEEEEEADVNRMPLACISVKTDDAYETPECSQYHHQSTSIEHCGKRTQNIHFTPPSDSKIIEETLGSNSEGGNAQLSSFEDTTLNKKTSQTYGTHQRNNEHFSCSTSCKIFTQKPNMVEHEILHEEEKTFICSGCGQAFTKKGSMVKHMTRHKFLACSVCNETFCVKRQLRSHMRTHRKEKPFRCTVCGSTFNRKDSMKTHMVIHTGVKPFSCSLCSKSFFFKQNWKVHMRVHTGEKNL